MGYSGIANSVGIGVSLDNGNNNNVGGTNFATNGNNTPIDGISTSPVSLGGGDKINVTISYDGSSTITETMTDANNPSDTFTQTYTGQNLQSILGSSTAYVGFTGGTGGGDALQEVSNFTYSLGTVFSGTSTYTNNVLVTNSSAVSVSGSLNVTWAI